ncbi:hypothetical protein ACHAWF_017330 [Thalassiosira exigua]
MNYSGSPTKSLRESNGGTPAMSNSAPPRLGVLGIGLIMEEAGKGARLVFRYPASPPPSFLEGDRVGQPEEGVGSRGGSEHRRGRSKSPKGSGPRGKRDVRLSTTCSSGDGSEGAQSVGDSIDLFFDLPARVIEKLFRPKRPLCGQPLTLNVSGTTFCCRAELFDSQPSTIGGGEGSNHPLVLFSVIVALAPLAPSASADAPLSETSQRYPFDVGHKGTSAAESSCSHRIDNTFLTVRCVHRNLARLCRVLTREELRCRYVSLQCNMLLQIRKDYESRAGPDSVGSGSEGSGASGTAAKPDAGTGKKGDPNGPGRSPVPMSPKNPQRTITATPPLPTVPKLGKELKKASSNSSDGERAGRPQMTPTQRREYVQELCDIMLAAPPPVATAVPDDDFSGKEIHGNLARELAQVFHVLSSPSAPSTVDFLSRDSKNCVFINRHVAIPLDPADAEPAHPSFERKPADSSAKQCPVRPYQALLFPRSSPLEVLESLTDGFIGETFLSTSTSGSLRRLLPHLHPHRSLHEAAWDAGLAPPHALEAAACLVQSSTCVASMPVLRKNRYACADGAVAKMAGLALPFWQAFGARSRGVRFYWGGAAGRGDKAHSDDSEDSDSDDNADIDDGDDDENKDRDNGMARRGRGPTMGAPHIFIVVSALTTKADGSSASPTLGEAIDRLSGLEGRTRDRVSPQYKHSEGLQYEHRRNISISSPSSSSIGLGSGGSVGAGGGAVVGPLHLNAPLIRGNTTASSISAGFDSAAEEIVYSMAAWLVANRVLVVIKDFLIGRGGNGTNVPVVTFASPDDALYHELLISGYLDGTSSVAAVCFQFGLDRLRMDRFLSWGRQTGLVGVISRMARPTDDQGNS